MQTTLIQPDFDGLAVVLLIGFYYKSFPSQCYIEMIDLWFFKDSSHSLLHAIFIMKLILSWEGKKWLSADSRSGELLIKIDV